MWKAQAAFFGFLLEQSGFGGRENCGLPDLFHEPAVPLERRAEQYRHADAQIGGNQPPVA